MLRNKRPLGTPEKNKSTAMASKKLASDGVTETAHASPGCSGGGELESDGQNQPPQWFTNFSQKLDDRFSRLEERMELLLVKRLDDFEVKLDENAEKITACSIQLDDVVVELKKLKKEKEEMLEKLDDLENRGRRNNLVFHGVPEGPGEKCQETIEVLLHDFVGISSDESPIERCHRTPSGSASTRSSKDKPRIIHVAFTSYVAKEKVRKACISKFKDSTFKGAKIYVSEDFSKRVIQKRKNKLDHLKRLKDEGKKPFFLFPDRLAYRNQEGKLHIVT